jgi:hypothetical protein
VAAIDARLRALERPLAPAAPVPLPKEATVEAASHAFPDLDPSLGLTERKELQALIRSRVEADYEALVSRLDEEVRRYAAGQEVAALARAEEGISRRREQYRSEYLEVVRRYADLLGPLILLQLALMPGLGDTAYFPPQVLDARGQRRTELEAELKAKRERMDAELAMLTASFRQDVAELRAVARREAQVASEQYRQTRLASLRADRDRQRRALEADLERALQEATVPAASPITPEESVFEGRRKMAEGVARANAAAVRTRDLSESRRVAALAKLRSERQKLVTMIEEATRTLAESIAREEGSHLQWSDGAGQREATDRLLLQLQKRWAAEGRPTPAAPPKVGRRA